jgi:hypothetical protein
MFCRKPPELNFSHKFYYSASPLTLHIYVRFVLFLVLRVHDDIHVVHLLNPVHNTGLYLVMGAFPTNLYGRGASHLHLLDWIST